MSPEEMEARIAIVLEAESWIGTPYHIGAMVKGKGVDCLTLIMGVFKNLGYPVPDRIPHTIPGFFLHRGDEIYLNGTDGVPGILHWAKREIEAPPLPGDVVLYRFGRILAHGGIVQRWPWIIHSQSGFRVIDANGTMGWLGNRRMRFFSAF